MRNEIKICFLITILIELIHSGRLNILIFSNVIKSWPTGSNEINEEIDNNQDVQIFYLFNRLVLKIKV